MVFSNLCTPAFIYFLISFIYLVMNSFSNFNIMSVIVRLLFIMLWSWILNLLCSNGYTIIAWIIIVLPLFFMFR